MAEKPKHKHVLTALPPVGFELIDKGQRYVVEASRHHVSRDGRATGVINWRSSCRVCGCDIRQETGFLIKYFGRNCAAHSKWNPQRVAAPSIANDGKYVAAPTAPDATYTDRTPFDFSAPPEPTPLERQARRDTTPLRCVFACEGVARFNDGSELAYTLDERGRVVAQRESWTVDVLDSYAAAVAFRLTNAPADTVDPESLF